MVRRALSSCAPNNIASLGNKLLLLVYYTECTQNTEIKQGMYSVTVVQPIKWVFSQLNSCSANDTVVQPTKRLAQAGKGKKGIAFLEKSSLILFSKKFLTYIREMGVWGGVKVPLLY
jgi:hypothetical protein